VCSIGFCDFASSSIAARHPSECTLKVRSPKGTNIPADLLLFLKDTFEVQEIRKERAGIGDEPELQA
jgi:hypothetical protein